MCKEWTIDTWVLYKAAEGCQNAIDLLYYIRLFKHKITLDHENHIFKEYDRCLKRIDRNIKEYTMKNIVKYWHSNIFSNKLINYYSGQLDKKHKRKFNSLKFDTSDWPFVAVCISSFNKKLIAEESDYTKDVIEYLSKSEDISILKINDCLNILSKN